MRRSVEWSRANAVGAAAGPPADRELDSRVTESCFPRGNNCFEQLLGFVWKMKGSSLSPNPPTCQCDEPGSGLSNGCGRLAGPPERLAPQIDCTWPPGIAAESPSGRLGGFLGQARRVSMTHLPGAVAAVGQPAGRRRSLANAAMNSASQGQRSGIRSRSLRPERTSRPGTFSSRCLRDFRFATPASVSRRSQRARL